MKLTEAVEHSVAYLGSEAARASLEADTYWPKWNSPWWHMLLLHELGEARRIPELAVTTMIAGLNAMPLQIFPIRPEELGTADPYREASCHCAVGSMYQVLAACGVDVDRAVPWFVPWFGRYQMADGGLNCDSVAYLVDECASSMVGTVPLFEAMLARPTWTAADRAFADRAASFLIGRELRLGSSSVHNAEERDTAPSWLLPCFPRFYLYDVLRGLAALARWCERTDQAVPAAASPVIEHLTRTFPDGIVRVQRHAHLPMRTFQHRDGAWVREPAATTFPLLEATSVIGEPSEALTRQWAATRALLQRR